MVQETKYSDAATEVLDILSYTNSEDVSKIPQSFIKFLTEIANKKYKVNFNHEKPINELILKKQTKELLGFIYITWWCDEKERTSYKNIIKSNNKRMERIEKYNTFDIFKSKEETRMNYEFQNITEKEVAMIRFKEENMFKKFFKKIQGLFTNKTGRK